MDRVVRHAIAQGLKPVTAIQMATLNTAQHFGLEREIGSIAPGRLADFLIVSDLPALPIDEVYGRGVQAGQGRQARRRHPGLCLSGERQEDGQARQASVKARRFRHRGARRAPTRCARG